jgi:hypothetical protein
MVYAPRGELTTSDYVTCWANQGADGIDSFGALQVVRSGRVVDVRLTFARWGTPTDA